MSPNLFQVKETMKSTQKRKKKKSGRQTHRIQSNTLHHHQPQDAARWWTVDSTPVPKPVTGMRHDMEVEKTEGTSIRGFSLMKSTLSFKGHRPRSALVAESVAVCAALASDAATQKGTDLG